MLVLYNCLFSPLVLNFVLYVGGCSDFNMADITDFVESPKLKILNKFLKDQLLRVADHYGIGISDKRPSKEVVKSEIKAFLCDLKRSLILFQKRSGLGNLVMVCTNICRL